MIIITTGAIAEKVYPICLCITVAGGGITRSIFYSSPLIRGKTPSIGAGLVLQVAECKAHFLGT